MILDAAKSQQQTSLYPFHRGAYFHYSDPPNGPSVEPG